jgi:hypothetical protein
MSRIACSSTEGPPPGCLGHGAPLSDDPHTLRYDIGSSTRCSRALDPIVDPSACRSRSGILAMVPGRTDPHHADDGSVIGLWRRNLS